jgi:HAD superfamily hydrolase (TIGR01549 family)
LNPHRRDQGVRYLGRLARRTTAHVLRYVGAVIARGEDYRQVFQHFRPGFDLALERQHRLEAGLGEHFDARDLYPEARAYPAALKEAGYFVGVAGNQTARAGRLLAELNLPVDLIATLDDWGVEKPSVEFFDTLAGGAGLPPEEIACVGDRLDNDILPAHEAGLVTVWLHRGPWAVITAHDTQGDAADYQLHSLNELAQFWQAAASLRSEPSWREPARNRCATTAIG